MKRRIISILVMFVFWVPVMTYAEDAIRREVMSPTPANVTSQEESLDNGPPTDFIPANTTSKGPAKIVIPREWYIMAKLPTDKSLAIGLFWIQEGMPIEHIYSILGNPQDSITAGVEECYGTILVYPNHYLLFSRTGNLQIVKERK